MVTRGPKTKENIKLEILRLKKVHPEITAKEIEGKLKKQFTGSRIHIPKERAIASIIKKNLDKITPSLLDTPWSIGSCLKANIPVDSIPVILKAQNSIAAFNRVFDCIPQITIRQARWIALLSPIVTPLIEKLYPDELNQLDVLNRLWALIVLSRHYSHREQITEIQTQDKDYPDTSDIDMEILQGELTKDFIENLAVNYDLSITDADNDMEDED